MQPTASPQVESKAGFRTTEFWITAALIVLQILLALEGLIPPEHAAVYATLTGALYKGLRTALKAWQGHLDLQATLAEIGVSAPFLITTGPDANGQARASAGQGDKGTRGQGEEMPRKADGSIDYGMEPAVAHPVGAPLAVVLVFAVLALSGCAQLDRYDRSYSLQFEDEQGRKIGAGVTLHARDQGDAKRIRPPKISTNTHPKGGGSNAEPRGQVISDDNHGLAGHPAREGRHARNGVLVAISNPSQAAPSATPVAFPAPLFRVDAPWRQEEADEDEDEDEDEDPGVPASWRRTLFYEGRVIKPIFPVVVLNGVVQP